MIQINLLPRREAARKKRRELFFVQLGLAVAVGVAVAASVFAWYQARIELQNRRNDFLQSQIRVLDGEIKEVASLKKELGGLRARQEAVESLQSDRNTPVYLLDEMVKQLPEGVYLKSLKQESHTIHLTGVAQSQERVSELLRNLGNHSEWLAQPQLVEITSGVTSLSQREQRRVFNFTLRVNLSKGGDAESGENAALPTTPPKKKPA